MKKIYTILIVAFVLALTSVTVMAFEDMPNDWSTAALQSAVDNGLLSGDENNRLLPKNNLTRSQMATVLVRALGATEQGDISAFTDVSKDKWYYSAMATSYKMGIFLGDGAGKLTPDANITRQEAFVVLARAFNLKATTTSGLNKFSDNSDVAAWARPEIEAMITNGYVGGSNGKLNPKANITRAEFAQVMYNLVKAYVDDANELAALGTVDGNVIIRANTINSVENITVNGDIIIGDGMSKLTSFKNVKVNGRLVIRTSGNISFDGQAKEMVLSADNTKVITSKTATINRIVINSGNSSVLPEGTQTPSTPTTPPVTPGKEEDIWTDFH